MGKTVNNNTEAGDTESSEEQAHLKKLQMAGAFQNNMIKVPELINPSSQKKNKFQEKWSANTWIQHYLILLVTEQSVQTICAYIFVSISLVLWCRAHYFIVKN